MKFRGELGGSERSWKQGNGGFDIIKQHSIHGGNS